MHSGRHSPEFTRIRAFHSTDEATTRAVDEISNRACSGGCTSCLLKYMQVGLHLPVQPNRIGNLDPVAWNGAGPREWPIADR